MYISSVKIKIILSKTTNEFKTVLQIKQPSLQYSNRLKNKERIGNLRTVEKLHKL